MTTWLRGLEASGGGDTPEQCYPALLLALQQLPSFSRVYVFTDAPTKQAGLHTAIIALAQQKSITISFLMQGSGRRKRETRQDQQQSWAFSKRFVRGTGRSEADYGDLATSTGGVLVSAGSSEEEIFNTTQLLDLTPAYYPIFLLRQDSAKSDQRWNFAVDSDLVKLSIFLQRLSYSPNPRLTDPSGGVVDVSGSTRRSGDNMLVEVENPDPGEWSLSLDSSQPASALAQFGLLVRGESKRELRIRFLQYVVTSRVPTFKELEGNPLIGFNYTLQVTSNQNTSLITHLDFISCDNRQPMSTFPCIAQSDGSCAAQVTIPVRPFCVQLRGADAAGNPFQETAKAQVSPTGLLLTARTTNDSYSVLPGTEVEISFNITNLGSQQRLQFLATGQSGIHRRQHQSQVRNSGHQRDGGRHSGGPGSLGGATG